MYEFSIVPIAANSVDLVLRGRLPEEEKEIRVRLLVFPSKEKVTLQLVSDDKHTLLMHGLLVAGEEVIIEVRDGSWKDAPKER